MSKKIEQLADIDDTNNSILSVDDDNDFERMLNDFISSELDNSIEEAQQELEEIKNQKRTASDEDILNLSELADRPILQEHEASLYRAYGNFIYAISNLCEEHGFTPIQCSISDYSLYPRFKRRAGHGISNDILSGWEIMIAANAEIMQSIRPNSSDDEILDCAESCEDENIQLALISYVETLIELEGCEIDYETRRIKYERRQLEKQIYEEHQRRAEKAKRYIEAIQAKNFPVNAERLVTNFFRLSNKDPEGSFKALTNNPATFAPIDFSKLKARFFGIIKVKPQDGIRINQKLGEFLKKLRV